MIQQKEKSNLINWEIGSVNPNNKIWNWKDLFCYWGANIQSIIGFSLIASLYLVYQLNLKIDKQILNQLYIQPVQQKNSIDKLNIKMRLMRIQLCFEC